MSLLITVERDSKAQRCT